MANMRVFPAANAPTTLVVNGRTYTCAVGSILTVPEGDAFVLCANGWLKAASERTGTTAQRPAPNPALGISPTRIGFEYYDTTVGANVIWNGQNWIRHATGATA
jgi:hypothetical protein